ncbi:MAG: oligosaccharide flippase family protein [Parerythrobacter sp.]
MSFSNTSKAETAQRGRRVLPPFLNGLLVLAAGSTSGRIITLAALPILTRLYTPEDFGVLALFTSIIAIAVPIATFRFNQAIPLALTGQSAACLAVLSLAGTTALALVLVPVGMLAMRWPAIASVATPILPFWPLIFVGIFAAVIFDILYFAGIRRQLNADIAKAFFVRSAAGTAVKLGAGALGFGAFGLLLGQIVQLSGGGTILLRRFRGGLTARLRKLDLAALRATARRYRAYPKVIMPSSLVVAAGMQAPIFMMAALYDARTVGYFAFATTLMAIPINVLNQTIGNAYYGEISRIERSNTGSVVSLTLKLVGVIMALGTVFAAVVFFFAPPVTAFVLGEEWSKAGEYISYMAIYAGTQIASSPMMTLFLARKRHLSYALIGSIRFIIILALWVYGYENSVSADDIVLLLSLILFLFYISCILLVLFELKTIRVSDLNIKA